MNPAQKTLLDALAGARRRAEVNPDLCEACARRFRHLSLAELVRRIEEADDFGYDDESVALSMRLLGRGQVWGWDGSQVRIYDAQEAKP